MEIVHIRQITAAEASQEEDNQGSKHIDWLRTCVTQRSDDGDDPPRALPSHFRRAYKLS